MGDALKRDTSLQHLYRKGRGILGSWREKKSRRDPLHVATERLLRCSPRALDWDAGRIFKSLSLCSRAVTQHDRYKALITKK